MSDSPYSILDPLPCTEARFPQRQLVGGVPPPVKTCTHYAIKGNKHRGAYNPR